MLEKLVQGYYSVPPMCPALRWANLCKEMYQKTLPKVNHTERGKSLGLVTKK